MNGRQLLDSFDTFIFDCDGVLWRGNQVVPGAPELIEKLRQNNKTVFFVTNNSAYSREMYVEKFKSKGFKNISKENILSSAYAAARYLSVNNFTGQVYVIGEQGIHIELQEQNIPVVGDENTHQSFPLPANPVPRGSSNPLDFPLEIEPNVGAVIVGFDRYFNYVKLAHAHRYLQNKDCLFIATNTDITFPYNTTVLPEAGPIVKSVETATKRSPIVVGKPSLLLMDVIRNQVNNFNVERTLMIGDRLDTDIYFGKSGGIKTLLVLSGVSSMETVKESQTQPDFIANSVADFLQ